MTPRRAAARRERRQSRVLRARREPLGFRPDGGLDAAEARSPSISCRAGGTVLDLGCGNGRVALALAARGFPVEGLDISPSMIEEARRQPRRPRRRGALPRRRRGQAAARRERARRRRVRLQRHRAPHARRQARVPGRAAARAATGRRRAAQPAHALRAQPHAARACCATSCCRARACGPTRSRDDEQYVQRPAARLARRASAARRGSTPSASARTARRRAAPFPKSTLPVGGQFYVVARERSRPTTSRACRAS